MSSNNEMRFLAGLTTSEEAHWDDRIHYIDMDASNLGGGIGSMISSFNSPFFMGIDRFNSPVKPAPSMRGQPNQTTPTTFP